MSQLGGGDDRRDRAETVRELLSARARLGSALAGGGTDCMRLCAGLGDGVPGLIVDRFGPLVVAVDYADGGMTAEALLGLVREIFPSITSSRRCVLSNTARRTALTARRTARTSSRRRRTTPRAAPGRTPRRSWPSERGLKFEIGVDPAHDFGLYLDAAKARLFVRQSARGQRVLNLFSYAGAFGVAAPRAEPTTSPTSIPTATTSPGRSATPRSTA